MGNIKIKGVDLSYCQEGINYELLKKNGVKYAIIRLGFGCAPDVTAADHIEGCVRNGIDFGFYWYSYATKPDDAAEETKACLSELSKIKHKPTYPVFWDMEEQAQINKLTTEERTSMAINFCDKIKEAGYLSGIYANPSWMENYYNKDKIIGKYDIWLAHWTGSSSVESRYNYGQTMWQWGLFNVGGYDVDGDISYVDYTKLNTNPVTPTKPSVNKKEKIAIGSIVTIKNGVKFSNGVTPVPFVYNTDFTVFDMSKDKTEVKVGIPNRGTTGWFYVKDVELKSTAKKHVFKCGDKAKINKGATFSDGTKPASWTDGYVFVVLNISKSGKEVLLGIPNQGATGWVYVSDITYVK